MNNQDILDNAPTGATHIDGEHYFCKDGYYFAYSSQATGYTGWIKSEFIAESRSLADLRRIVELESKNAKMLECLCDISDACIGQLTMSYSLDAQDIGQSIYEATGMTNPELNALNKAGKAMNNSQFKRTQAKKHNMERIETMAYEMDSKLFPNSMLFGNSQSSCEKRKAINIVLLGAVLGELN